MAQIVFISYPIAERHGYFSDLTQQEVVSTVISIGRSQDKLKVEVNSLAEAETLFDAYVALRIADNKPLQCSAYWPNQSARKIRGFDKACQYGGPLANRNINEDLIEIKRY